MNTFIAYKTKNGASKEYAGWLAAKYKTEPVEFEHAAEKDIKTAKKIFIISGTYGGVMPLTDFTRTHWNLIKSKDVTLIAVGMAPEKNWWSKLSFFMLPGAIKQNVKYYKLPGLMPDKEVTEKNVKESNLDRVK